MLPSQGTHLRTRRADALSSQTSSTPLKAGNALILRLPAGGVKRFSAQFTGRSAQSRPENAGYFNIARHRQAWWDASRRPQVEPHSNFGATTVIERVVNLPEYEVVQSRERGG